MRIRIAVFALVGATEGAAQLACFDPATYSAPVQEAMLDSILDVYGFAGAATVDRSCHETVC
ncbi:hypothetical protein [Glycomyces artemisiae]|uniref:Uncharacterized protein n=1 Tax=Glycomyces artemisiae TaxID=1076443 RepID=A0A2T0UGZ7_9ACTN|nr:hypothetical protein [Glycomyces artemisiae]PRY57182.1 hypothetical protein B0I28_10728 [Glycomyces artemisiae]